ncbi:hypothetical protein DXG03_002044 [Asterophora parasitica]|uniref:Uncharacterized protein n=1 Tax=Asterophora parasitica TaxID=117018 RepID=A0A9P7K8I6_9AGAR|nr:hypothetical protein DXG03_002044 [Asterophora parasitica]
MTKLINFLKSDDFRKEDLHGFDIRQETRNLDRHNEFHEPDDSDSALPGSSTPNDGWMECEVSIQVPDGQRHTPDTIPTFTVPGLFRRSLVEVMKRVFSSSDFGPFHYTPFKSFQQKDDSDEPQRLHDELYSSDAMIEADQQLQHQPQEPGCNLERVLPDTFEDFYIDLTGKAPLPDISTHCRRELLHAVWKCILDGDFLYAYEHGIVIRCPDGILRRFYPRFFTYSADYPEKVLLATIRNLGKCPCPRCTLPKERIPELGTQLDLRRRVTLARRDDSPRRFRIRIAREFIYERGFGVKSAAVERILEADSLVPTFNAFSILARFGFNFFEMLPPDFMHEVELGDWMAVLKHLLRILFAIGGNAVQALNYRYRQVPTFGRATIRRFSDNVAGLKKLAARNYEDLLQVCNNNIF